MFLVFLVLLAFLPLYPMPPRKPLADRKPLSETLSLWGKGAVTLPKAWRERYATKHFLAKENERGYLVIMPILDVEYWEDGKDFGLHFPHGMEMGKFVSILDHLGKNMYGKEVYARALKEAEKEHRAALKRKKNKKR